MCVCVCQSHFFGLNLFKFYKVNCSITMELTHNYEVTKLYRKVSRLKMGFNSLLVSLVLIVCFSCVVVVVGANNKYPEQFLESVEVCAAGSYGQFLGPLAKKKIRLANFPNNTVSVRLTRWEDLYASFYNFRCKFLVTAPKHMGVMVVIQSLRLRKTSETSCRDYLQFQQDEGYKSSRVCGVVEKRDRLSYPGGLVGPRKFYDPSGEMDVTFFTDSRGEDDRDGVEEPIQLNLVFTAYKECTGVGVSSGGVKSCSNLRSHSCISSHLFCDGTINCGFPDEGFGMDEKNCGAGDDGSVASSHGDDVDRTISIYVFAITTVATLVVVVVVSLIVCCCLRRFSNKNRRGGGNNSARGVGSHRQGFGEVGGSGVVDSNVMMMMVVSPSAPPQLLHASQDGIDEGGGKCGLPRVRLVDEDMPPSYSDLFPGGCDKKSKGSGEESSCSKKFDNNNKK